MIVIRKVDEQRKTRKVRTIRRAGGTRAEQRAQSPALSQRQQKNDESLHVRAS